MLMIFLIKKFRCGHCKSLQPIWNDLAGLVKDEFNVAKVDVTENRELGERFGIKGFPTIKFFHGGEVFDYKGKRSVADFKTYVQGGYQQLTGSAVPARA
jgi:thiol-disulfide isomerase/thioredoxin